jgi:hypothetical protein
MTISAQLHEHIERGKQAYRDYANKEIHEQIRSSKEVASYNVGDTKMFWRYNFSVMPPGWINQQATCRAVGERSYVFVADADWGIYMTQQDVDSVFKYLENATAVSTEMGIVEMDELYFGSIPDELDGDPKVIFYYSNLGSYSGSVFDGYFSAFNQLTEAEAQMSGEHSNECEMLYMSCNPVDPSSLGTLSVLSHELQHLIHFGKDPNEETWVDEGCAEFAMVLFGQPDPISSFPSNSDNNLTAWDQNFSDYVKTMLFFTYLSEQTTGPDFITDLVSNTMHGISGIENTLEAISFPLSFQEIFTNWTLANYIDDTSAEDGQYGYEILDLPAFAVKQFFLSYPASKISSVNACASHYYKFSIDFTSLEITADFPEGGEWELNLLAFEDDILKEIIPFTGNTVSFENSDSYALSKLVLVVTNKEIGTGSKSFSFSINDVNSVKNYLSDNSVSVYPNPVTDNVIIDVLTIGNSFVTLNIYNMYGQKVISVSQDAKPNETNSFLINTCDLNSGAYFIDIVTNEGTLRKKLVVE